MNSSQQVEKPLQSDMMAAEMPLCGEPCECMGHDSGTLSSRNAVSEVEGGRWTWRVLGEEETERSYWHPLSFCFHSELCSRDRSHGRPAVKCWVPRDSESLPNSTCYLDSILGFCVKYHAHVYAVSKTDRSEPL